jgi:hypothetical protein
MEKNKSNRLRESMATELKELISVQGSIEAEVIKSLLASHGIPCLLKGLVVQSVHAFTADGLGKIKIMVGERDLETAKQLIQEPSLD